MPKRSLLAAPSNVDTLTGIEEEVVMSEEVTAVESDTDDSGATVVVVPPTEIPVAEEPNTGEELDAVTDAEELLDDG